MNRDDLLFIMRCCVRLGVLGELANRSDAPLPPGLLDQFRGDIDWGLHALGSAKLSNDEFRRLVHAATYLEEVKS